MKAGLTGQWILSENANELLSKTMKHLISGSLASILDTSKIDQIEC